MQKNTNNIFQTFGIILVLAVLFLAGMDKEILKAEATQQKEVIDGVEWVAWVTESGETEIRPASA